MGDIRDIKVQVAEHHSDIFKIDFISTIEKHPNLLYADTDSVLSDTKLIINDSELSIEKFFNTSEGDIKELKKNHFIKVLTEDYITPSVSQDIELQNKKVTYIMKHKVKKRFFKVKIEDKEIIITEDHSLIVLRNNKLISIKPKDLENGDKLFKIYRDTEVS